MTPLYSNQARKYLNSLDARAQRRIRDGILSIPDGDISPLKSVPGNYRMRIGDWRILFAYAENNTVRIKKIGPRGQVYKGMR